MPLALDPAAGRSPSGRPPPTEQQLDALAGALRDLIGGAELHLAIRVGTLIVQRLYGGDPGHLPAADLDHEQALSALARRDVLPLSAAELRRCVDTCQLVHRLGVSGWKHLTAAHFRAVLALDPPAQEALLARAERERWTSQRLRDEVAEGAGR